MAEILSFTIETSGYEALEKEVNKLLSNKTKAKITEFVNEQMRIALARHVQDDVYDGGYYPRQYVRRDKHPEYGKSIKQSAYDADGIGPSDAGQWVAGISYEPTGQHDNIEWYTADGDELIGRIEKKSPMYTYYPKDGFIPDRPFWQNFVSEMIEGGGIEDALNEALQDSGIEVEGSSPAIRTSDDGKY